MDHFVIIGKVYKQFTSNSNSIIILLYEEQGIQESTPASPF
jgi:hypothetical protein